MFDALVQDLDSRLDLGGKASALVRTVLAHIFQTEPGGLSGLLDRFRKVGRGDLVSSWVGNPAPREVTWSQLEGTLGDSVLRQLADKAGVSVAQARPAVALLLPRVVGLLTADGRVPSTMPASVSAWIGKTGSVVGTYRDEPAAATVGTYREAAGATTVGTYREPAGATVGTYREPVPAPAIPARRIWSWLLPLAGLGVIGLIWALWPTTREVSPPAISQQPPTVSPRVSSAPPTPPPVATPPAPAVTAPAPPATTPAPAVTAPVPEVPAARAVPEQWPLRVFFATDSQAIRPDDSARIKRAADYLRANPGTVVDITGFADKTGPTARNHELSAGRAKVVQSALVAAGAQESQTNVLKPLKVTGSGRDPEARRVEVRPKS